MDEVPFGFMADDETMAKIRTDLERYTRQGQHLISQEIWNALWDRAVAKLGAGFTSILISAAPSSTYTVAQLSFALRGVKDAKKLQLGKQWPCFDDLELARITQLKHLVLKGAFKLKKKPLAKASPRPRAKGLSRPRGEYGSPRPHVREDPKRDPKRGLTLSLGGEKCTPRRDGKKRPHPKRQKGTDSGGGFPRRFKSTRFNMSPEAPGWPEHPWKGGFHRPTPTPQASP